MSLLLSLALVLGLMPGMSLTAYAEPAEELLTTITAVGSSNANPATSANVSYSVENVATLSFSGQSSYNASWGWWGYGLTATVSPVEGYTITKCVFYDNNGATATDSEAPFVVETTAEDKKPQVNGAIFGGNSSNGIKKIEVYGYVAVAGVELSQTEVTLEVNETMTLTSTVAPDNAADKSVTWSSDNTDVATVSEGVVTAVAEGTANITVTTTDGSKTATCAVTVTPPSTYTLTIPSTLTVANSGWNDAGGISATGALNSGKKLTVTAASANNWALKSGDNSVGYNLATATGTYSSSATPASWEFTELSDTATTKPMGIIVEDYSSMPAGTYRDNVTFTAKVESAAVAITAITLNKSKTTIAVGSTETLSVENVTPYNATDESVTWSSGNTAVATVNATTGEVTAVAAGTATITATAKDGSGVTATCTVTVTIPVTSVTINNAPTEALFVNSTGTLTATVSPNNATDKTVTWSSDNPNHVKIDAATGEYTVTGVDGYGSATITATATNGTEDTSDDVTATCTITGKVTYTSLSVGTVLRTGDTFYTGENVYFNTNPAMSFFANNGVITVVEDTSGSSKYYKFQRGSNGTIPNVTAYKIKDNTDGVYITGGSGTSSDKFTLAVHTTN